MHRMNLSLVASAKILLLLSLGLSAAPAEAVVLEVDCASGPYFTLQAAVNAASPGDVVLVHNCLSGYSSGASIVGKQDLRIVGADVPLGWVGAFPVGLGISHPFQPLIYDNGNTCLEIEQSNDISVAGLILELCGQHGISIIESHDIQIDGNQIYSVGEHGVLVEGSSFVQITGNYLRGAKGEEFAGIFFDKGCRNGVAKHNRLEDNFFGIWLDGLLMDVINNQIENQADVGIYVFARSSTVSRNTVINNGSTQIDFTAQPADTCVLGNETSGGLVPTTGCQAGNT